MATGGDGTFLWSSGSTQVATVTQSGLVKTFALGSAAISCNMARNHHNRELATVHVLPPRRLEIIEYVMEAEIGVPIHVHVALYADRPTTANKEKLALVPFTQCKDLPFAVEFSEQHFVYNKSLKVKAVGISCATLAIVGTSIGTSKVCLFVCLLFKFLELELWDNFLQYVTPRVRPVKN